jgi:hypothetical protein
MHILNLDGSMVMQQCLDFLQIINHHVTYDIRLTPTEWPTILASVLRAFQAPAFPAVLRMCVCIRHIWHSGYPISAILSLAPIHVRMQAPYRTDGRTHVKNEIQLDEHWTT